MESIQEGKMKRGAFLKSLGLSTSTLMAFYCLGTTLTACGTDDEPEPGPTTPGAGSGTGITGTTSGAVNFTVDLTHSAIAPKLVAGDKFIIAGDVLVAQTTAGSYVALSKTCTHQGSLLVYRSAQNDLFCDNHFSEFSTTGAVEQGPASTALKAFKTTLSADGKTLTVTA